MCILSCRGGAVTLAYAAMHATVLLSVWRTAAYVLKAQQTWCTVAKLSHWACILLALRFWHGVWHGTVRYGTARLYGSIWVLGMPSHPLP
jgi:hypothetical protein